MEFKSLYKSKLATPADAVERIASGVTLSMGMAMNEPPDLLKALADRAAAG
jgi:itaconate CoA-transferase